MGRAQRLTLALLFTDIVGSTRLANRMGDEQWIQVVMKHASQARMLMYGIDCYEIKMIGDAFMVAFRTVDDALDFAFAFQGETGDTAIKIRAGIHVGSVYLVDDDLYGKTVNYASRVVSAPPADWIVLSDTAKNDLDLTRTRSRHNAIIRITDLGNNLKGFPAPNKLWRALTQEMDKTEKAKAAIVNQPLRRVPAEPAIRLPPVPTNENALPERKPEWWKVLLAQSTSSDGGRNPFAGLLRSDTERDKKG